MNKAGKSTGKAVGEQKNTRVDVFILIILHPFKVNKVRTQLLMGKQTLG